MANKLTLRLLFLAALTSIGLNIVPAFATTPGKWVGAAEFGTFDLFVDADGTGIEKIVYHFSDFTCGSTMTNGGISVTPSNPWPISMGSFNIINFLDSNRKISVSGLFGPDTVTAGTWEAVFNGEECDGTWSWSTSLGVEDPDLRLDHAYVKGVYWNPEDYPGWGFFADIQEDTLFGAIYGYMGSDSTFITLQGTRDPADPLVYQGDVFFVTGGGSSISDVGDFTWSVGDYKASPAAILTITSNILNATDLDLVRFVYAESDKVDMLTGADWNIIRRVSGVTFGDHYAITDKRTIEDGTTFAEVVDNTDASKTGVVSYVPPEETDEGVEGDFYAMLVEFDIDTVVFYTFIGTNADMYGRYWLLDEGEEPTGNGSHFRAAIDSWQVVDTTDPGGGGVAAKSGGTPQSISGSESRSNAVLFSASRDLEELEYDNADEGLEPLFSEAMIRRAFQKLRQANQ